MKWFCILVLELYFLYNHKIVLNSKYTIFLSTKSNAILILQVKYYQARSYITTIKDAKRQIVL